MLPDAGVSKVPVSTVLSGDEVVPDAVAGNVIEAGDADNVGQTPKMIAAPAADDAPDEAQVTTHLKYLVAVMVKVRLALVAPEMLVQVLLSGDICHWMVMPVAAVYPVSVNVTEVEVHMV
jgi:hypothetical protein